MNTKKTHKTTPLHSTPTRRFGRKTAEHLFPPHPESCELTISCRREDYCASQIARAVEDAEAHLLNLNVTSALTENGNLTVELRVSHRNSGAVSRSLERYGYTVEHTADGYDMERLVSDSRLAELMAHLNL